jgi:hypothetical protein
MIRVGVLFRTPFLLGNQRYMLLVARFGVRRRASDVHPGGLGGLEVRSGTEWWLEQ